MTHLFCFGYGYTAQVLGKRLLEQGWHVSGTSMSQEKADQLRQQGVHSIVWQAGDSLSLEALDGMTHILQSIPPNNNGDPVINFLGDQLNRQSTIEWAGYLSTTGVYGNHDGGWVDETTPLTPTNRRSEYRVMAEQQCLTWGAQAEVATHIFRLPSIYGAYRNTLTKVQQAKARRIKLDNQYFSRIHVEDIATVLEASINHPQAGEIYNVADDLPSSASDLITYASQLLGVAPPPLQTIAEADLSPMASSFYKNSKRVRNDKIKQQLGVTLKFPDYKVGLNHIFETGNY